MDATEIAKRLDMATARFWDSRRSAEAKHRESGGSDVGGRASATSGKAMDGFVELAVDVCLSAGASKSLIFCGRKAVLPSIYTGTKTWDVAVVKGGRLLAAVEFKSHVGSFGNNFRNRVQEANGIIKDLRDSFDAGILKGGKRPFAGFFMLVEQAEGSTKPISDSSTCTSIAECHRSQSSYTERYTRFLTLTQERNGFDSAALLLTERDGGREPPSCAETSPENFFSNLGREIRRSLDLP